VIESRRTKTYNKWERATEMKIEFKQDDEGEGPLGMNEVRI